MIFEEGKTINVSVGEHLFITPPMPRRDKVLFQNIKRKEDQFWTRQRDFPKVFFDWHNDDYPGGSGVALFEKKTEYHPELKILLSLSKEDSIALFGTLEEHGVEGLQTREHRRRKEGVWFFNDGEPTFLTGNHYASLQWLPMKGCTNSVEPGSPYGQYYQFQRDGIFYYFEICKTTPYGRGGILIKPKKTGATQAVSLICANEGMTSKEKNIRMMSITETLAKESNFGLISYALNKVPNILMPSRSKQNEGEVIFGPPNTSRNPLKKKRALDLDYLYTWICTVPTIKTAFDSFTNYIALIDEFPKIKENTYPEELFLTTIVTVMEGFQRKGTIFAQSYVPEQSDRSFYESRILYKDSKLKTRKINADGVPYGETKSKLICHTLTVQEGMFNCCDRYGKAIPERIWEVIRQEKEDVKHDPIKVQAVLRQYPTNEGDPWMEGSRESTLFDNIRLSSQEIDLEDMASRGEYPYIDFNLEYENAPIKQKIGDRYDFSKIQFKLVSDNEKMGGAEHGKYLWYDKQWTPDWYLQKHLGRTSIDPKTGLLMPNPVSPFFISIDPTNFKTKKNTGVASLNSFGVFQLPDAELNAQARENVSNYRLMIEYFGRRDKPSDTLHDMIKLMLFIGCHTQIESNMATWAESLIQMGLGNFLLVLNKDGALEPWQLHKWENGQQVLFTSQDQTIPMYIAAGREHLGAPLNDGEIDNIKYLKSLNVISQLKMITREETKWYDAAVMYLEGIMGAKALMGWRRSEEERKSRRGDGTLRHATIGLLGG
jgi:hypothetical protein